MLSHFFLWPFLGGVGVAFICAPLGAFMVWQRLAFLGDSLGHGALFGLALSFVFSFDSWVGLLLAPFIIAGALSWVLNQNQKHAHPTAEKDSVLLLLSQGALAGSLITLTLKGRPSVDLVGYLFGDILTLQPVDVAIIFSGGTLILGLLFFLWNAFLSLTLHEDMALVEGYRVGFLRFLLFSVMALALGFGLKIMGALLISTLLIAPPLTAQLWARSPESLCVYAAFLGLLAVLSGLFFSFLWDLPAGPTISGVLLGGFFLSTLYERLKIFF